MTSDDFPAEEHQWDDDELYNLDVFAPDDEPPPGPHIVDEPADAPDRESAIVAARRLPDEFWDQREIFKRIRQAAWATQTHPDAVLAAVLCRVAGMVPHGIKFDSGRGPRGSLNLFACILAPSGIGKSEASDVGSALVEVPRHLADLHGNANPMVFRDGVGIGTGEGIAEVYMGMTKRETGEIHQKGRQAGEPVTERVRGHVRNNAYIFVDEGETLTRLMRDRRGSTLGPTIRTAWTGRTLGQANASEETTRFVPSGTYSLGMLVGYQPDTAVEMLREIGPGTPQRFLWFGAQDVEMPEDEYPFPGTIELPQWPSSGVVEFPPEIRAALKRATVSKHRGLIRVDPLDSHEPLMRCKLAGLFAMIDGRLDVIREDWRLGGMVWQTSTEIRNTLLQFRQRQQEAEDERRKSETRAETEARLLAEYEVSSDVERVARRITAGVCSEGSVARSMMRRNFGRDKVWFDAALAHARRLRWIAVDQFERTLTPGDSHPA